ncbi:MAG: hypothetical protein KGK07_16040 [Chloroflexota bacterium]|nr:hypothetical protein [Chloroflexota bacterium]
MPFLPPTLYQHNVPLGPLERFLAATAGTANDFEQALTVVPNPQLFANGVFLNAVRGGFKPGRMQSLAFLFVNDSASVVGIATHTADLRINVYRKGVYQGPVAYYSLSVATTLGTAIVAGNQNTYVAVTPASMAGIVQGGWLVIDAGTATQEYVMVASVTATTFTALFTQLHTTAATVKTTLGQRVATPFLLADALSAAGTTTGNAVGAPGVATVLLASPYGVHVGDALLVDTAANQEQVSVTALASVDTTSGTAVAAPGSVVITPASMASIAVGTPLTIDGDAAHGTAEVVNVTAVTATTFTATFANAHTTGFLVRSENFTATFAKTHASAVAVVAATGKGALANGFPFELQESDVLTLARVSSDLTGIATPAGALQVEWRPSERAM